MSVEVDHKIVEMKFDNKQFEEGIKHSMRTLKRFKESLEMNSAAKEFKKLQEVTDRYSMASVAKSVGEITKSFSLMGRIGLSEIEKIADKAVKMANSVASALTIDPLRTGLQEYETQINSIQTILSNTKSKGSTLEDVKASLRELNEYADMTIYNFTEMTRNIGTFTAAGVDLETSTNAIKGIANLAAISGSTSQQASNAMYQLSQALATGRISLMDWNSVVNAGMGGQVFQDQLVNTARTLENQVKKMQKAGKSVKQIAKEMGYTDDQVQSLLDTSVDKSLEVYGTFRESLSEGKWLTSKVLTETLAQFTMTESEANRQMLINKGYTEDQIKAIFELGEDATNAATKVKTLTQLWDVLKEAAQSGWTQTWEYVIGDFEEARSLFTGVSDVLTKMIGDSADARNAVIKSWADLGGRQAAIDSVKNSFKALIDVIRTVREAFREIFPAVKGGDLVKITAGVRDFTKELIPSADQCDKLKRAAKGLFSIFKMGIDVLSNVMSFVSRGGKYVEPMIDGVLSIAAAIGDVLSGSQAKLESLQIIPMFFNDISKAIDNIAAHIPAMSDFKDSFSFLEPVGNVVEKFVNALKKFPEILGGVTFALGSALGALGAGASHLLSGDGLIGAINLMAAGSFIGISNNIKKMFGNIAGSGKELKDGFEGIPDLIGGVKDILKSYQKELNAKALVSIAKALAILAGSMFVLSTIDPADMLLSLGTMTALFKVLPKFVATLTAGNSVKKVVAAVPLLIGIGTAMVLLASSMKVVSTIDPDRMVVSAASISLLALVLSKAATKMASSVRELPKRMGGLLLYAASIKILASSVKELSALNVSELIKGISGLTVTMAAMAISAKIMSKIKMSSFMGLISIATAVTILTKSVRTLSEIPSDKLVAGVIAMASALGALALSSNLIPKKIFVSSVGLLALSAALIPLVKAMQMISTVPWQDAALMVSTVGSLVAIIATASTFMKNGMASGAGLIVMAAGVGAFIPVLLALSAIPLKNIGKGLLALSIGFGGIAALSIALAGVIPSMVALAGVVTLLGVSTFAVGAGIAALGAGLVSISAAGASASVSLVAIITSLIGLVPMFLTQVGLGILAVVKTIGEGAPLIVNAFVSILSNLIKAGYDLIPNLMDLAFYAISMFIYELGLRLPDMVSAGVQLIISLIEGLKEEIPSVLDVSAEFIDELIKGLEKNLVYLVDEAFKIAVDFLNELAETFDEQGELVTEAVFNLAGSIVDGLVNGLLGGVASIVEGAKSLGRGIIDGLKDILDIHSPSRETFKIGKNAILGLANALSDPGGLVPEAVTDTTNEMLKEFNRAVHDVYQYVDDSFDYTPTIRPVIDMSDVYASEREMNEYFGKRGYVGTSSMLAVQTIRTEHSSNTHGSNATSNSSVVNNFTQYNYSPKALSRTEIYRQSKNLFAFKKGAVSTR